MLWNLEIQVGLLPIKVNENSSFAAKAPMLSPNVRIAKYKSPEEHRERNLMFMTCKLTKQFGKRSLDQL